MARLTLCATDRAPTTPAPVEQTLRVLKFPGAPRDVVGRPDPRLVDPLTLARSVERTLDHMQSRINDLRREVIASIGHDDPGDHRPAA